MGYDIGPKIGIEGEAEFRRAIQQVNTSMKTLGTEMKVVTSAYDKNDKSAENLSKQNVVLNKQITEQKSKLDQLKAGLAQSATKYGENDKVTQGWQQSVNKATADLNNMERQLKDNNGALDQTATGLGNAGDAADKSGSKFGKMGNVLKVSAVAIAAVVVAAGVAVAQLGKAITTSYADYEQLVGGVDTLFKESSSKLQDYAANAYKTAGLSSNQYMETVTSFSASLISSLGGDTDKAVKYADMAITDMSDNANKMGTDTALIQNSYQGFAKQNYTMLDNLKLGYGGTKTEMERLLKDASAISGIKYDISSYADVVAAIHTMQESMGIAGTTAKEAEGTITGSLNAMGSSWANLLVGFGRPDADMGKLIENIVNSFNMVVANITPIIENIVKTLPLAFKGLLPAIVKLLPLLINTITILFNQVLSALLTALPELIPVMVAAVLVITDALIDNLPLLIEAAIVLVTALADGISKATPSLMPKIVDIVVQIASTIIKNLPMIGVAALKLILALVAGLIFSIPKLVAAVPKLVMAIVNGFLAQLSKIKEIGTNIVKGVWQGISASAAWLLAKVKEWCGSILNGIKAFFGIKSPSRIMAQVGKYIVQGLAKGIDESKDIAVKSAKDMSELLIKEEERLQKEIEKLQDKQESNLKESLNNQLKAVQSFRAEYENAIKVLQTSQDNLEQKLKDYGDLFTRTKDEFGETFELADQQERLDTLNAYSDALERLKDRQVPATLLNEIEGMSIDDAMDYTNKLLSQSDEDYNKYIKLWEENQAAAKRIAETFYKDEMDSLKTEFVDKIPTELSSVKDSMRDIGVRAGQGLATGFKSQSSYIKDTFVNTLNSALAAAKSAMEIHSPSRKWAEVGKFMAAGLGQGFTNEMMGVTRQINSSIPVPAVDYQAQSNTKMGEGIVNGLAGIMGNQNSGGTYNINLVVDGKTLAQTVFDPLKNVARQRGVVFGG